MTWENAQGLLGKGIMEAPNLSTLETQFVHHKHVQPAMHMVGQAVITLIKMWNNESVSSL